MWVECPLCDFLVFFVVVVVALIVVGNHLWGKDGQVVIPLGNIIYLPLGLAGVGGVSFARIFRLFCRLCRRVHSRLEAYFGKGRVGQKPSGKYYIPCQRDYQVLVEFPWRRLYMLTLWDEKRMCGIDWPTFSSTVPE